jgi:hypothetical protein
MRNRNTRDAGRRTQDSALRLRATRRGRAALATIIPLAGAAVVLGVIVLLLVRRPSTGPVASPAPIEAPRPLIFSPWLKFESAAADGNADLQDHFIDAVLGHQVFQLPPQGLPLFRSRELLLDDDHLLLSSGRRLWTLELLSQPGLAGKFCYLHKSFCVKRLFEVQFFVDGKPVLIYDNQFGTERYPSYSLVKYFFGSINVDENKYITYDDRAVCTYQIRSADKQAHQVDLDVIAPYLPMPDGKPDPEYPLLGSGTFQRIPVFAYLDAPGFTRVDKGVVHLRRTLNVPATGTATAGTPTSDAVAQAQVAVSFENAARPDTGAAALPDDLLAQHRREYNHWFFDNVPYFDASDPSFKKMWYYRWWVVRFNMTEADTPDLKGYRFYEGKLGFDNAITFAVPAQLKELTYLRDPRFGLQQLENSYRTLSAAGAVVDPAGSPYWGEMYSQWIAAAGAEFNRVHPIPPDTLRKLLPAMASDVRAWVTTFDPDGNGLPQRDRPRSTGYDLDILSYWYFNGTKLDVQADPVDMERVDFASFVYANARAVVELARIANNQPLVSEFQTVAEHIRTAVLQQEWDDQTQFFYPQRAADHVRAPIRELHGFFPFTTLLAPDEPRYVAALKKFVDPDEFWARFPPVITSQYHYRQWTWDMDGLTRNIAPHPISMGARTLVQVLKHYHQNIITPDHFMDLMARYNALVYPGVNPFDPLWRPNVHEYYSKWEPHQVSLQPKPSDISHDFHSMYCSLVVEGVVGLTPRTDERIELQPAALSWTYFLLDRLRYRGKDLTIVWDQPGGRKRYAQFPEGFSLYIDGRPAFTRDHLGHFLYDPATGAVEEINGPSPDGGP